MAQCILLSQSKIENDAFNCKLRSSKRKKTKEDVKGRLLNFVTGNNEEENTSLDKTDVTGLEKAITAIRRFKNMIKTKKKRKIISLVAKQGKILKIFKDTEQLFETVGLSKFAIYLKIIK